MVFTRSLLRNVIQSITLLNRPLEVAELEGCSAIYSASQGGEHKELSMILVQTQALRDEEAIAYVVCSCNGYAILERMPTHMQNFLVEIDLIRICFLSHPSTLTTCCSCWAAGSGAALLPTRWTRRVNRRWDTNFLCLKGG